MTEQTKYLTCAETAKLVRRRLKLEFPGVKFSVRSHTYAGGASITVYWTDGPTTKAVDGVVGVYEGSGFDGMIDLAYSVTSWLMPDGSATFAHSVGTEGSRGCNSGYDYEAPHPDAVRVRFGADSVSTSRELSVDMERVQRDICTRQGIEFQGEYTSHVFGSGDRDVVWIHANRLICRTTFAPGKAYAGLTDDPDHWAAVLVA